jgi:hypothetical protein
MKVELNRETRQHLRVSEQMRRDLNRCRGQAIGPAIADEREHFYSCPLCRQSVDRRMLGDVLYHEQIDHEPIPQN